MKTRAISKVCREIDTDYRYTFHPLFDGESGLIEIEVEKKGFFGNWYWKRIYYGQMAPINEAVEFYNQSIKK